ncbi:MULTISPECIES: GatB/YqeY domain-containing protein [Gracilibacillus]|uniref:GatB/YqeY domain-containing protein n=1 Tax=Gracilibacillus TaxID=74385 RepID=UPI000825C220|nr:MULTISPECIES: GatB/YqeY domain-containing protein [Gracilibacillus]
MAIVEQLNQDMKQAMKNKEKLKLGVIRMVKAAMQNEAIKLQKDTLTDDEELTVLSRELKQRKDSLHEFKEAGREDLAGKLEEEITVVQSYMPEQLSDEALEEIVVQTIAEVQAQSKKDMGKVMSSLMPKVKGKAEGARVNQFVQKNLS